MPIPRTCLHLVLCDKVRRDDVIRELILSQVVCRVNVTLEIKRVVCIIHGSGGDILLGLFLVMVPP
jgi:hypothetical protein